MNAGITFEAIGKSEYILYGQGFNILSSSITYDKLSRRYTPPRTVTATDVEGNTGEEQFSCTVNPPAVIIKR